MNYIEFKLLRESLHLSRHDLAEIWEVSPRAIQRWDKGELAIPQNRKEQLLQLYLDVRESVLNFKILLKELEENHNKADEILLLAYDNWSYDGNFPSYKIHNSCLIRCKQVANDMGYKVKIVPFEPREYANWLGDEEDNEQRRSEWASLYFKNI